MHDYSADIAGPTDAQFARLSALIDELNAAEREAAEAEDQLRAAQAKVKDIAQRRMPDFMDSLNLKEFVTSTGLKVKLKKTVHASIPKTRRTEAFDWLEKVGCGGLIKRNVTVKFTKDQEKEAHALMNELSGEFPQVAETMKVEPATLQHFVRERLEAGEDIDLELFGVFERRTVQVGS